MDGVISLDDELHLLAQIPHQQQLMMNRSLSSSASSSSRRRSPRSANTTGQQPVHQYPGARGGRASKRTRNGAKILAAADMIPQFVEAPEQPAPILVEDDPTDYGSSVIMDGQDVFYIQEVEDGTGEQAPVLVVPDDDPEEIEFMAPPEAIVPDGYVNGSDTDDAADLGGDVEQQLTEAEHYYKVEPMELSDIWNDLITANQEILILLELSDLKHHIVDARKIEEQLRDMACEYCGRVFPDIQAWDRHVRKIHFQTELFECDSCDGRFTHFARFRDHLNGHTGHRVYQCDECNHQYAFRMGFLVHKILDHMKLNGIYVCPKCKLDCHDAQNYKLHIASHIEFGPQNQRSPVATYPGTAGRSSGGNTAVRKTNPAQTMAARPPFYPKENERNQFLNVYETFSQSRKSEQSLPLTMKRKKYQ